MSAPPLTIAVSGASTGHGDDDREADDEQDAHRGALADRSADRGGRGRRAGPAGHVAGSSGPTAVSSASAADCPASGSCSTWSSAATGCSDVRLEPFEAVVRRHGPAVLRVCRAVVGPDAADDAWSETFLAALRAYPELPPGSNVEA